MLAISSTIFALVAIYFLYGGLSGQVVVSTAGGDVANLQLMHIQSINIALGIGAAIISALFAVGAALVARRERP